MCYIHVNNSKAQTEQEVTFMEDLILDILTSV